MTQVVHGDASANQLNAVANRTQVYGLAGNDTLTSDNKSDVLLVGGSGNDSLIMSGGNGTLSGGAGNDTFEFTYSADKKLSAIIEDLEPTSDKIIVNFDGSAAPQLTSVTRGNDVVLRDDSGNFKVTLKSVRENDYFDGTASNQAWEVLLLTNNEREKQNLPLLKMSDGLTAGATVRAEEIANLGQDGALNDHTRPNGEPYYTVLDGKYNYTGENLDGGAEFSTEVISDWMNSDSHKKNILDKNFRKLGVGYNYFDIDESNHRWYWVQLFADGLNNPETITAADLLTASPEVNTVKRFVTLTEGDDTYSNNVTGATIDALGGNDSISNTKPIVSISGGNDDDTITNSGSFVTINAGTGNDSVRLMNETWGNVIEYTGGNDTISGFNDTDTLKISSDEYTFATVGNNVIMAVGNDSITFLDATESVIQIFGSKIVFLMGSKNNDSIYTYTSDNDIYSSVSIDGGAGDDSVSNFVSNVTILGGDGNDRIYNDPDGSSVSIYGGTGDDSVINFGSNVTIDGGEGDDTIYSEGSSVSIDSGTGDDSVRNYGSNVTITGGEGNDEIYNDSSGFLVKIDGGAGDDSVRNYGSNVTISGAEGSDSIYNHSGGSSVSIDGGAGNDYIENNDENVTISGAGGSDLIYNGLGGSSVSIDGGAGNDTLSNVEENVTISGGSGHDFISNSGSNVKISGDSGIDNIYNTGISVSIDGGADDDYIRNLSWGATIGGGDGDDSIFNWASAVTISGNKGDDLIENTSVLGGGDEILFIYKAGDGYDSIIGFNETDTLSISGAEYTPMTIGNNLILEVGTGYIWFDSATDLSVINIDGKRSEKNKVINLSENPDFYENVEYGVMINALGGDDSIINAYNFITINGGDGNDSLLNDGLFASIDGGNGNDSIFNASSEVTIHGGEGNDAIGLWSESTNNVIQKLFSHRESYKMRT